MTELFSVLPHLASPPLAPAMFRVSQMNGTSATIEWSPPTDNGGSNVLHYILEKRDAGKKIWTTLTTLPPSVTECELENMDSGKDYFMRIKAVNKYGVSEAKEIEEPIVIKGVFKGM